MIGHPPTAGGQPRLAKYVYVATMNKSCLNSDLYGCDVINVPEPQAKGKTIHLACCSLAIIQYRRSLFQLANKVTLISEKPYLQV